jgi:hypothetical protein
MAVGDGFCAHGRAWKCAAGAAPGDMGEGLNLCRREINRGNTRGLEKVVAAPKMLIKTSVEDAKKTQKTQKTGGGGVGSPRAVPGIQIDENREDKEKKAEAENNELKTNTELHPVVFAYLGFGPTPHPTYRWPGHRSGSGLLDPNPAVLRIFVS